MYFPTSLDGIINRRNEQIMIFILMSGLILIFFLGKKYRSNSWHSFVYSYFTIFILLLFTLVSLFKGYTGLFYGVLTQYFILSLLFVMDFSNVKLTNFSKRIFELTNVVNIILGFAIVFSYTKVDIFLLNNYSNFYPDLLYNMLVAKKPVIMFSSPGLAGIIYFLFFFINFKLFTINKRKFYLVLAILNLTLLFYTKSTTSYFLFLAGISNVSYNAIISKKYRIKPLVVMLVSLCLITAIIIISNSSLMPDFNSDIHGFNSRYSADGNLSDTIDYILNTLTPIGIASVPGLFNADSGWLVNILRGSIFLLFTVYTGFYLFLKKNISNKNTARWIFLILIATEAGFQIMTYIRIMYFLPFLVVYLHDLVAIEPQGHSPINIKNQSMPDPLPNRYLIHK